MQARRVHARYMLGMKVKDIAAMEGITPVSYTHLDVYKRQTENPGGFTERFVGYIRQLSGR